MQELNIIGGVTASVLSPFIEGWQQMLKQVNYNTMNTMDWTVIIQTLIGAGGVTGLFLITE